jgi:crossover junction endodeoxyribonuclease RuvC
LIVLGIDPGSIKSGYAFVEIQGKKLSLLGSGTLRFNQKDDFLFRLKEIKRLTQTLISRLKPDQVAFESLIYVKNPTSLSKLAQARGIMLSVFVDDYENKIFEYSPNSIKLAVAGHGHADKVSIQKSLKMMFRKSDFESDDESDAIAVAVCHALNSTNSIATKLPKTSSRRGGLAAAVKHKIEGAS